MFQPFSLFECVRCRGRFLCTHHCKDELIQQMATELLDSVDKCLFCATVVNHDSRFEKH